MAARFLMGFEGQLATLATIPPPVRIEVSGPSGLAGSIENRPGSQVSLRVYQHLILKHGRLDAVAAREGLDLFAEHAVDARRHPGRHPNIDRLLQILENDLVLDARLVQAEG